jgi:hypothetical protein
MGSIQAITRMATSVTTEQSNRIVCSTLQISDAAIAERR